MENIVKFDAFLNEKKKKDPNAPKFGTPEYWAYLKGKKKDDKSDDKKSDDKKDDKKSDKKKKVNEGISNEIESRIEGIARDAQDDFWEVVSENFPEVTSGDFPPDASFVFDDACEKAIGVWLDWNHPDRRDED